MTASTTDIAAPTGAVGSSYDDVPYFSHPYAASHPRRLAVNGRLFGLSPADPATARVLEIGCAAGGNLIPVAFAEPGATCVGIDLSARQIEEGQAEIAALGLDNIRLEHRSVADVTPDFGQFDYIICHGVFSWVTPEVQNHILRVCQENLAPGGVAYVSYNTLPGWNGVKSLRDMMLYHTSQFADPATKVDEAVRMLRFVSQGIPDQNAPLRVSIEQELKTLEGAGGWYLYHDHLEQQNNPVYFHVFAEMAAAAGLRYVGDSNLASMYVENLPKTVADTLRQIPDIVRQEQYMDFVRNRRFRATLLTHADTPVNPNLAPQAIFGFALSAADLAPDFDPASEDWSQDSPRNFGRGTVSSSNRFAAMLLTVLHQRRGFPIAADDLAAQAAERLGGDCLPAVRQALAEIGLQLALRGRIVLHLAPDDGIDRVSERPEAWALARHQAAKQAFVTSPRHDSVKVDELVRTLLPLVDGTRTTAELGAAFEDALSNRGAVFSEGNSPVTDPQRRRAIATEKAIVVLNVLRDRALLVA